MALKASKIKIDWDKAILALLQQQTWATYVGLKDVDSVQPKCALRPALKRLEREGKIKSAMWTPLPGGRCEKASGRVRRKIWFLAQYTYEYVRRFE